MTLYQLAISIHVVTAILGVGQIAGLAVLATSTPTSPPPTAATWRAMARLATVGSVSLAVMLLSGVLIDYSVAGGYHKTWWFRLSFIGILALGATLGRIRRTIRKNASSENGQALVGVRRAAWAMCVLVGGIAVLMQVKPW